MGEKELKIPQTGYINKITSLTCMTFDKISERKPSGSNKQTKRKNKKP